MNLVELLEQWRQDEMSEAELHELTRLLATRESRARLRQEWFLDVSLPTALQTASLQQPMPTSHSRWFTAWKAVSARWRPTWRWAMSVVGLVLAVGLLGFLAPSFRLRFSAPGRTAQVELTSPVPGGDDLQDLTLLVATPPVPVLHSPQDAWLTVLKSMTEGEKR